MDSELHEQLVKDTEALRELIGRSSSEAVAGMCAADVLRRGDSDEESTPLMSPARQIFFLLGLMLTTPEPSNPKDFGREEWQRSVALLNAIYSAYALMFWPKEDELPNITDEWRTVREVAMSAFLHYFNTGVLASAEQVSERIRRYIVPFDTQLKAGFGITASEAPDVIDWLMQRFQKSADELQGAIRAEEETRLALLHRAEVEGWDFERLRKETQEGKYPSIVEDLSKILNNFLKVSRISLLKEHGERIGSSFWALFVVRRGEVTDFRYLTEQNGFDPLSRTDQS